MKFKYIATAIIFASIGLSACDININTGSGGDSKDSNKQDQNSKNNDSDNASNNNNSSSSDNNSSSNNNNNNESNNDGNDYSSEVTRENVIDKVEDYEGHTLDTEQYTYKEPEQSANGEWGFSFTDKDGDLAGSYIIDPDGFVTKYDEDGEPE